MAYTIREERRKIGRYVQTGGELLRKVEAARKAREAAAEKEGKA